MFRIEFVYDFTRIQKSGKIYIINLRGMLEISFA